MTSIGMDIGSTVTRAWVGAGADPLAHAATRPGVDNLLGRLGDPTPLLVDGVAKNATLVLGDVVETVLADLVGADRARPIVVAVPTAWGQPRRQQVREALALVGARSVEVVSSAEAVVSVLTRSGGASEPGLPDGSLVAVVDVGGHDTSAAVVRVVGGVATLVGEPDGEEGLGGADLDRVVHQLLREKIGGAEIAACWPQDVQPSSVADSDAGVRLVRERLSGADEVAVDVAFDANGTTVVVTAAEFVGAAQPVLDRIAELAARVVDSTRELVDDTPAELRSALVVGGVAQTPAVAEAIRVRTEWPVVVPAHPELLAVRGAAGWLPDAPGDLGGMPALESGVDILGGLGGDLGEDESAPTRSEWQRARPKIAAGVAVTTAALIAYTLSTDAGAKQDAQRAPDLNPDAVRAAATGTTSHATEQAGDHRKLQSGAATPHLSGGTDTTSDYYPPAGDAPATGTSGTSSSGAASSGAANSGTANSGTKKASSPPTATTNNQTIADAPGPGLSDSLQQMADGLFKTSQAPTRHQSQQQPRHRRSDFEPTGSDVQGSSDPVGSVIETVTQELNPTSHPKHRHRQQSRPAQAQTGASTPTHTQQQATPKHVQTVSTVEVVHAKSHAKPTAAQLEQQRKAKEFYANMKNLTPEQQAQAGQFFKNLSTMTPEQQAQAGEFFKALAAQQK